MSALRLALPVPHSRAAYLAITISTGLAILLLIASALLAASNVQKIGARERVANQARAAELATETLLSTLKDAETGQRGFLLTGDDSYLAPYEAARARLEHDFSQLEAAPLIDPARARLIEHMRILAAAKLEVLARTIMLYRSGQLDASLELVRTNRGKQMMDAIRADADALQTDVAAKTIERNRPPEDARPWIAVFGLVTLACLLLGGVALAQRRARIHIANSLSRLERFTRAFSLSQGMTRIGWTNYFLECRGRAALRISP